MTQNNNRIAVLKQQLLESSFIIDADNISNKSKYVSSIMAELLNNKDVLNCSKESIFRAIKQAVDLGLEIDNRQHCHLMKYKQEAKLMIGYRGYIYKIKQKHPDANFVVEVIREGENVGAKREGENEIVIHERPNLISNAPIIGAYCSISYKLDGRLVSKVTAMDLEEIKKIRSKAMTNTIWSLWFEEKAKVAVLRRACKVLFAGLVDDLDKFDNQDYDVDKPIINEFNNIIDDLPSASIDNNSDVENNEEMNYEY